MITRFFLTLAFFLSFYHLIVPAAVNAQDEEYTATVQRYPYDQKNRVVGNPQWHQVRSKETLLDIAREYGLGYNDMALLYPKMDPWLPTPDQRIAIPSLWVLPPTQHQQLVINIPELRLYYFDSKSSTVQTYPIGIGDEGWESPLGSFYITEKRPNPSWYVPLSLQAKYGMAVMPPGPQNPLGEYMMKFSAGAYGVHGTAMPWGVGRLVSHGCIRCYPEHIRILYPQVSLGTKLEIIYEPIKFGRKDGAVFVEVHPDVYNKVGDFESFAMNKLRQYPHADLVDEKRFKLAVSLQNGVPTNVTFFAKDDFGLDVSSSEAQPPGETSQNTVSYESQHQEEVSEDVVSYEPAPQEEIYPEERYVAPATDDTKGNFSLQTISLRGKENAYTFVEELQAKGYTARVETADLGSNGVWYRVMVGNFETREEALDFAAQFQQKERMQGLVVRNDQ